MYLISTRKTHNGDWTYFKVDDDQPRFYSVPTDSFALGDVQTIDDADAAVAQMVAEAKANMPVPQLPMILIFVHGYNNTVQSAGNTAMAIAGGLGDVNVRPCMAVLSWSTDGKIENYEQDRSDARASELVVSRIIQAFARNADVQNGLVAVNMLTHSMGNYLMDLACESMASQPAVVFNHSISVAADINRDDFNVGQQGDMRCRMANHVTFYYDGWDGTLAIAELVLHRERFGMMGPHHWDRLLANTVGVNCSDVIRAHTNDPGQGAVEVGIGVHSMYFAEPTFYQDLAQVLTGVSPGNIPTRRQPPGAPANSYRLMRV